MKTSPLTWLCSFLTLHSVSFSATQLTFAEMPNEMQLAIMDQVDFCDYVEGLNVGRGVLANTDVGMAMLMEVAEEERNLELQDDKQRFRKQKILKKVRTFVRIRSRLPIDCTEMDKSELRHLAGIFESSYEECAPLSESPTWKKACMAGLFGRNTLVTLLPNLPEDFCSHNKDLLLKAAFLIGDIDSVKAIVDFFKLSEKDMLEKVPEIDIVFSGSVEFFDELFDLLPNLMEKSLGLIREACFLSRLNMLTRILKVAKLVKLDELNQILVSFCWLEMFKSAPTIVGHTNGGLGYVLVVAAQHGHTSIIRFLWPAIEAMRDTAEAAVDEMMVKAGRNNHRSVIEFLLWHSGTLYMRMAQKYVNKAFEAAIEEAHVELVTFLMGDDNAGNPVAPGLGLTTLRWTTLEKAIRMDKNGNSMQYIVRLKEQGDRRFAKFELVNQGNVALCIACEVGNYELVDYLLWKTPSGEFVFPLTNPAARDNQPLVNACVGGNLHIVKKLLEHDLSGNYVYKGIAPSAQNHQSIVNACFGGHLNIVEFLLKMKDGKYVLPGMEDVNFTRALLAAIYGDHIPIVECLLERKNEKYVFPAMKDVDLARALSTAIDRNKMAIVEFLLRRALDGRYLLPGVEVTEDMLTIIGQRSEMTNLLARNLEQQRSNAQKRIETLSRPRSTSSEETISFSKQTIVILN